MDAKNKGHSCLLVLFGSLVFGSLEREESRVE